MRGPPDGAADQIAGIIDSETNNIKAFFAGGALLGSAKMPAEPEFDGLCTTYLALKGVEFPGNPEIQSTHNGRTYWFASSEAKKMFDDDPDAMLAKIDR